LWGIAYEAEEEKKRETLDWRGQRWRSGARGKVLKKTRELSLLKGGQTLDSTSGEFNWRGLTSRGKTPKENVPVHFSEAGGGGAKQGDRAGKKRGSLV